MKQIITALLIVLIGGLVVWDVSKDFVSALLARHESAPRESRPAYVSEPEPKRKPQLPACAVLLSKSGEVTELSTVITGKIRNDCGRSLRYIQVTFKTHHAAGNVVGTALENQTNLGAGEIWQFEAHSFAKGSRYALDEITVY